MRIIHIIDGIVAHLAALLPPSPPFRYIRAGEKRKGLDTKLGRSSNVSGRRLHSRRRKWDGLVRPSSPTSSMPWPAPLLGENPPFLSFFSFS